MLNICSVTLLLLGKRYSVNAHFFGMKANTFLNFLILYLNCFYKFALKMKHGEHKKERVNSFKKELVNSFIAEKKLLFLLLSNLSIKNQSHFKDFF